MGKQEYNYKDDFDFILKLKDCKDTIIGWPNFDWVARFWTTQKANAVTASCIDGECVNCFNDGGQIHIVMNGHRLSAGVLNMEFTALLDNDIYPDGDQRAVSPIPLDIELIRGCAPCPCTAEVVAMLPYIKFQYEDLTPEQKAELQAPATEAAKRLDTFVAEASAAEEQREAAELSRIEAETARLKDEADRRAAEAQRAEAEEARQKGFATAIKNATEATELAEVAASAADTIARKIAAQSGKINVTINFGSRQTVAQEMNFETLPVVLTDVSVVNISQLLLTSGDVIKRDILSADAPQTIIAPNAIVTLEAERITDGTPAYAFLRYRIQDNDTTKTV